MKKLILLLLLFTGCSMPTKGIILDKYIVSGDYKEVNKYDTNGNYSGEERIKLPEKNCLLIKSDKQKFLVEVNEETFINAVVGSKWAAPVEKNE